MPTRRQIQVANAVQQRVSELLQRELKDPRIGFVTVTRAEMSQDLKYARVYISVLGNHEEQRATMEALASARGFIRRELGARLGLRFTPELTFKLDTSAEYSDNIARLLNELKSDEANRVTTEQPAQQDQDQDPNLAPLQPTPPTPAGSQQEEKA